MAYEKGKSEGGFRRRGPVRRRKKVCVFCGKENNEIDYKDVAKLRKYVSERGKILPVSYTHLDVYKRQTILFYMELEPDVPGVLEKTGRNQE